MKKDILGLLTLIALSLITLQGTAQSSLKRPNALQAKNLFRNQALKSNQYGFSEDVISPPGTLDISDLTFAKIALRNRFLAKGGMSIGGSNVFPKRMQQATNHAMQNQNSPKMKKSFFNSDWYNKNRRNIYSSLWAYASLNYLYADIVQFMDKNEHLKYHTGTVNGFEMTPGFIAGSAAFMQIAIANVVLPQVIKNDRTLRWVQIASGTIMTLVQSATLFVGEPTPYYVVFSGFEIAATAYITIDAIRWKSKRKSANH
jgi:hypothetical protein